MNDFQHVSAAGGVLQGVIDTATSGDVELVAAVVGKKIRVLSLWFICTSAVTVGFESHNAGGDTKLSGVGAFPANGGMVLPHNPFGCIKDTVAGEALHITLGGAIQVSGAFTYQVLD